MNPVFIHTFDKAGTLPVRESCYPVRALPGPSRAVRELLFSSSAASAAALQIESCFPVRALPGPSRADRELLLRLEPLHVHPLGSPVA